MMIDILKANEFVFFLNILTVGFFLLFLFFNPFLISFFSGIFILLTNILVGCPLTLFSYQTTCAEPFAIGLFYLGIINYYKNKTSIRETLISFASLLVFSFLVLQSLILYDSLFDVSLFYLFFKSYSISCISFLISFLIERGIFIICYTKNKISFLSSLFISLITSQFCDTILYTMIFFKDHHYELFFVSYSIKIVCIIVYLLILLIFNREKDKKIKELT